MAVKELNLSYAWKVCDKGPGVAGSERNQGGVVPLTKPTIEGVGGFVARSGKAYPAAHLLFPTELLGDNSSCIAIYSLRKRWGFVTLVVL